MAVYEITRDGRVSGWMGRPEKQAKREFPPPPDPKPGELYIHVYDPDRDDWGRVKFFLYWWGLPRDDIRCPGLTLRGQVFSADERPRIAEALERGDRVYLWPSGEEVMEAARP